MRPAAEMARIACAYDASITIIVDNHRADARSLFEILILGVTHGQMLELAADGQDADAALNALISFLESYRDSESVSKEHGVDSFAA